MKSWIFAAMLAVTCGAQAQEANVVVVPATGYGDTFEQAVESALGNAIKQVNGATVTTKSASPKVYAQIKNDAQAQASGSLNVEDQKNTREGGLIKDATTENKENSSVQAQAQSTSSSKTTMETGIGSQNDVRAQGKVKSYSVTKQECGAKGCVVELQVSVEKFDFKSKMAKADRDSIAVITIGRLRNSGIANQLRQSVTDKLVKSGRFTVLDRTNDAAFERENDFLNTDNVSDQQRTKLGQALGADFMLILNLTQASVATSVNQTHVNLTGESNVQVSQSTNASMHYTLVETATRAVKWSDSMSFSASGSRMTAGMEQFQDRIVGDIAEIVSPPKVIAVQNGRVIINRGMGLVREGQMYDIYAVGDALIDPDTGEKLGAAEEKVAVIQIGEVQARVAYGTVTSGSVDAITKGAIARVAKPAPAPAAAKKAPPKRARAPAQPDQTID